jgi:hypothetical protein
MASIESNIRRFGCAVATAAVLLLCADIWRADELQGRLLGKRNAEIRR